MNRLFVSLFLIGIFILTGCSDDTTPKTPAEESSTSGKTEEKKKESEKTKNEPSSMIEVLKADDKPLYYSDEKEVKAFRNKYKKKKEISIGQSEYSDASVWHMSSKQRDGRVSDFEFYLDRLAKPLTVEEGYDLLFSFIPPEFLDSYEKVEKTKRIDDDGESRYYWVWNHKDFYNNNPDNLPGNITLEIRMKGNVIEMGRVGFGTDRWTMNYEKVEWDIDK